MRTAKAKLESVPTRTDLHKVGDSLTDLQFNLDKVLGTLRLLEAAGCNQDSAKVGWQIDTEDVMHFVCLLQERLEALREDMNQLSERCEAGRL